VTVYLRGTEPNAALATFHGACKLFYPARFQADVLPSFVERFLHLVGHVDDLRRGNNIVPSMNEAIKDLVEPETVLGLAIIIEIANLTSM
jgi:hypothetical protein